MLTLEAWATRWGVSNEALQELNEVFTAPVANTDIEVSESEASIQAHIKLEASRAGCRLWRNNSGVAFNESGQPVRFGLGNESKQMNEVFKSADLIGIRPVIVTADMVGHKIGQFLAREVKESGWAYGGTTREQAQLAFLKFIAANGGDARFANSVGTL